MLTIGARIELAVLQFLFDCKTGIDTFIAEWREMEPPSCVTRPTVREWKRQQTRVRYQQRLARAPGYRIALAALLLQSLTALIVILWPN